MQQARATLPQNTEKKNYPCAHSSSASVAQAGLQVLGHPNQASKSYRSQRLAGFLATHSQSRNSLPCCKYFLLSLHFDTQISLQLEGQKQAGSLTE